MQNALATSLRFAAALAVVALVGSCATGGMVGGVPGPAAPAPVYHVGDRWVYHVVGGYRRPIVWDETHEVTAVANAGITESVMLRGTIGEFARTERWGAPGVVLEGAVFEAETARFDPPLVRYRFPLAPGDTWSQTLRDLAKPPTAPYGPIQRTTVAGGYERITTPAGTFDALRMRIFMRLDDETFWRFPTECTYLVWYAPSIGTTVREEREAHYTEKGSVDSFAYIPTQNYVWELVSYSRGG